MTDQSIGGISVPLTIDRSGWSANLKAARQELDAFKRDAQKALGGAGGGTSLRGGATAIAPMPGAPQGSLASVGNVSPRFTVSAGAVRDMRIDINRQLRMFASQGEAVQIPVKLGRVPYAQMRTEISAGIGEVPIRVMLDPTSIASIRAQIMRSVSSGAIGGGGQVTRRASGGPVYRAGGGPARVTDNDYIRWLGGSRFQQEAKTRLKPAAGEIDTAMRGIGNLLGLLRLSGRNPEMSSAGRNWYTEQQQIHKFDQRAKALGVTLRQFTDTIAILSSGAQWYARKQDAFSAAGVRRPVAGPNIVAAEEVIRHIKKGDPLKSAVVTSDMLADARRYFAGTPMTHANFGPKRAEFAASFHDPRRFVIDRWQGRATTLGAKTGTRFPASMGADVNLDELEDMMARSVKGKDWTSADAPGPAHRRASVFAGERVADMLGIEPRGVQAESWTEMKRLEGVGNERYILQKSGLLVPRMRRKALAGGGPIFKPVDAERFHGAVSSASQVVRPSGRRVGETVSTYPVEDYAKMRTYLNKAGTAGYALKDEDELVSVFNVGEKGAGKSAIRSAVQRGARRLDAFDEVGSGFAIGPVHPNDRQKNLPKFYGRFGFRETGRMPWDPQYAPEGWQGGTPDVVFMERMRRKKLAGGGFAMRGTRPVDREYLQATPYLMRDNWQSPPWAPPVTTGGKYIKIDPRWLPQMDPTKVKMKASGGAIKEFEGWARSAFPNAAIGMGFRDATDDALGSIIERMAGIPGAFPKTSARIRELDVFGTDRPDMFKIHSGGRLAGTGDMGLTEFLQSRSPVRRGPDIDIRLRRGLLHATRPGDLISRLKEEGHLASDELGVGSIMAHEFGHAVDFSNNQRLTNAARSHMITAGEAPSKYGAMNPMEAAAEWFGLGTSAEHAGRSHPMLDMIRQMRNARHFAGGGFADGNYVVNELGREKFVPARLEHMIPADVMAQIPQRANGGITEIEGHGPRLWQAPEDGWIIPARLAGKVPAMHKGGPAEAGHQHPHMNRQGTGFQDEYGRPVANPEGIGQQPIRETWRGIFQRPPQYGPPRPSEGWRGVFFRQPQPVPQAPQPAPAPAAAPVAAPAAPQTFAQVVAARRATEGFGESDPATLRAYESVAARDQARAASQSLRQAVAAAPLPKGNVGSRDDINSALAQARADAALNRGLTARSGVGGLFAGVLGGGAGRRRALAEGQALMREYARFAPEGAPRGADPVQALGDQLSELEKVLEPIQKQFDELSSSGKDMGNSLKVLKRDIDETTGRIDKTKEAIANATSVREEADAKFAKAQGGAARNILSLSAAGFAFTAASEAISTALTLATQAARPLIDEVTGFGATATRVTAQLGDALPQAGRLEALFGQRGVAAGLSGQATDFLEGRLGPSAIAVAGSRAAGQSSDLFRAAQGVRQPTGLIGGFGGLFGSSFAAELFGGGKGFAEQIAGDIAVQRGRRGTPGPIGDFFGTLGRGAGFLGETISEAGSPLPASQTGRFQIRNGVQVEIIDVDPKVNREFLNNFNQALGRGRVAEGAAGAGPSLVDVGVGSAEAQRVLRIQGLDDYTRQIAEAGVVFKDSSGNVVTGLSDIQSAWMSAARGFTVPSTEAFGRTQAQQLRAGRELARMETETQTNVMIPGQLGQSLAANPLTSAFAGIPGLEKASANTIKNLTETQRLQDEVTAEARAGVEAQARFVDQNIGGTQGTQFRQYMAGVTEIGQQIAGITEQVSNRQAQVSFMAYSNNIRILNRSISDARGLLTGRGGAGNLGAIQRQQFDLSRQSQRLSLESQRLQLQSNELQLQLSQRQINFQVAVAGFQAPGITGQERAARMAEAELEASFAQKQLDIAKQQQGIGTQQLGISGQQFGLEFKAFMESARRSLVDLEAQRSVTQAQFALEQEQIAAQRRIAVLTIKQGQLQAKAQALFQEATGNFNAELAASAQYVAMFGGTAAAAAKAIRTALGRGGVGPNYPSAPYYGDQKGTKAAGYSTMASGPTSFIAGEAGPEHVLVLRNPRSGVMGGGWGGGGNGGGSQIMINISGNTFGANLNEGQIARQLADEVERRLETKARLMAVSA